MQKLYIKIAQHTLLIILLWFQNIFGSYFSQSFNRRSGSNSKIIAHFWSNLPIQIYHITCKIHSKRRILLINICNYNCTHIFPLIWHLEDLLLISLISWHAQCLVSSKNPNNFHWRGYFFFLQKITWQITYSSFTS